jgi:hypothetical protein
MSHKAIDYRDTGIGAPVLVQPALFPVRANRNLSRKIWVPIPPTQRPGSRLGLGSWPEGGPRLVPGRERFAVDHGRSARGAELLEADADDDRVMET